MTDSPLGFSLRLCCSRLRFDKDEYIQTRKVRPVHYRLFVCFFSVVETIKGRR